MEVIFDFIDQHGVLVDHALVVLDIVMQLGRVDAEYSLVVREIGVA